MLVEVLPKVRRDFLESGSPGSPDFREAMGGLVALRFAGDVATGPPSFLLIEAACSGSLLM